MVKEVTRSDASEYLKKSEEFFEAARDSFNKERFNAAGFNATQSIINANDALTIHFLGKRASKDHREAIQFHVDVIKAISDNSGRKILSDALDIRNLVGYMGVSINRTESERVIKSAAKFLYWVKIFVK